MPLWRDRSRAAAAIVGDTVCFQGFGRLRLELRRNQFAKVHPVDVVISRVVWAYTDIETAAATIHTRRSMFGIVLLVLAVVTLILYVVTAIDASLGGRRIAKLGNISPIDAADAPSVSAVIPACNEERNIREALTSVLGQRYPRLEIIAVDDRSTDRTGAILDDISRSYPELRVVHVRELPAGWLGKNHALQAGAEHASGEWLLFADADVVMDPTALARALRHATVHNFDHVAIAPRATVGGFLANSFLGTFALLFSMHTKPWKVRDPEAKEYIGIGAFNLVRTEAYRAVGGHTSISLRPDDDLQLGRILKQRGFRQDFVSGTDLLSVEWYASFAEMRSGLMKNLFSVLNYNLGIALFGVGALFLLLVWPWIAAVVTRGPVEWVNFAIIVVGCLAFSINAGNIRISRLWCLAQAVGGLVAIYLILRAAFLTLKNDGIDWRGTHYPLAELRKQLAPLP